MKLSDYVIDFLAKQGIRHAFVITGGAAVHLIDSIAKHPAIDYVCTSHEQAAAMAADAYSRVTGNIGVAISTSGPGATNMLTGICGAYYDSVPTIYITGQVTTFRLKGKLGVRQIGFQETDVINIFKPITKYAVQIDNPKNIRYELEKAFFIAKSDRPGPVLIDIPDNLQREEIDPEDLKSFSPQGEAIISNYIDDQVNECVQLIKKSERPVIILGWGVRLANAISEAKRFIEKLGFPILPTWAMMDMLSSNHPLVVGSFGTHGTRYGNFAAQNSDLIISVGARLDTREAGSPLNSFAREAKKIIVDVDPDEIEKFKQFKLNPDVLICANAKDFLENINQKINDIDTKDISKWIKQIDIWKKKYPICPEDYYKHKEVNPYVFVKTLAEECDERGIIFLDTGCALAWMMQAFEFKENQRLFHDFNNTAMGYALPASIGACFASNKKQIVCVTGDGSLQMNIQELSTIIRHWLPIKIFLVNNHGYSMIQQTQEQWLDSRYEASTVESGLSFPNFIKIANAYGYKTITIRNNKELSKKIQKVFASDGPVFCNVEISSQYRVIPQVKFGRPIEDPDPLLNRDEFMESMIVNPLKVSQS